jgi:flavin reductase (DIM6/NTAB) family NADH-FMN oxidoreductase RutF
MTASFVMPVSFEPKLLAFSISPHRYTYENLKEVPEFGINVLEKEQREIAIICGTRSGREADKFEIAKITKEDSKFIKPPLVKECPISLECKVEQMVEAGDHFIVIGRVVNEVVRKKEFIPLLHVTGDKYF